MALDQELEWTDADGWRYQLERSPVVTISPKDIERAAATVDLRVWDAGNNLIFRDRIHAWDGFPVLVPDGTEHEEDDGPTGKVRVSNFRESPLEAARSDLAHTVRVVTKDGPWVKAKPGTVSTFYSGTGDGFLQGQGSTWSEARAASGTIALNTLNTYFTSGCDIPGAFYEANQAGFAFDTSAVPDTDEVSAATLSLYVNADLSDVDSTHEVRIVAFGTLATADFIAGASLSGITRIASIATSGLTGAAYNDFIEDGTGLRDAVNLTGLTELWLTDSVQLSATNPSGRSMVRWSSANEAGTTQDPKLVVTHAPATVPANLTLGTVPGLSNATLSIRTRPLLSAGQVDGLSSANVSGLITRPILGLSQVDGIATATTDVWAPSLLFLDSSAGVADLSLALRSPAILGLSQVDGIASLPELEIQTNPGLLILSQVDGVAAASLGLGSPHLFTMQADGAASLGELLLRAPAILSLGQVDGLATAGATVVAPALLILGADGAAGASATLQAPALLVLLSEGQSDASTLLGTPITLVLAPSAGEATALISGITVPYRRAVLGAGSVVVVRPKGGAVVTKALKSGVVVVRGDKLGGGSIVTHR